MSIITELLNDIPIPKMIRARQQFSVTEVQDVAQTLREEMRKPNILEHVQNGMRIAIAVGSRGMADLPLIVRTVVEELKACDALPFVVPAMGSHGGATAEGQKVVLANLGVTEESVGCPIYSSMDVIECGKLEMGLPVMMDKLAYEADGIVVINRIKAHNAFSGPIESGLSKMITIGLGKQKGADSAHAFGFTRMTEIILEMTRIKLEKAPFLFGVGTVENSYDRIAKIVAVRPEEIIETDEKLLIEAKANLPKILLQPIDVLIVDQIGKEFSGGGMDPHTIGRASTTCVTPAAIPPSRMVALDVTDRSHGNCCGMGLADLTTRRLFNKIDFDFTYANILTSTATPSGRIPLIMESDRLAIQGAIKTCGVYDLSKLRMVRIPNTLHLDEIFISEALLCEAKQHPNISLLSQPEELVFDNSGNLVDIGFNNHSNVLI
jgi:hypothetical protein